MISLKKHTNKIVNSLLILFVVISFPSCKKEIPVSKEIARVGNSILTQKELERELKSKSFGKKYKEEFIRSWIETEVLYQKALKEGIIKDSVYQSIVYQSKKELAGAMLLNKIALTDKYLPTKSEIENYYNKNKEEFRAVEDAFVLNEIQFKNQNKAILFRQSVIEKKWKFAILNISESAEVINSFKKKLLYKYQIQPVKLTRVINGLIPGHVSVVLETEPGVFTVVQLIDKIKSDSILPLRYIKDRIAERLKIIHRKIANNQFIEKLYDEFNVHLTREK
ncbi:peptidylprolyl isomerase [bacterium BMS3Abin04]|nr:peptidylprolyl isomerase [bacterium BMS3Abin04]